MMKHVSSTLSGLAFGAAAAMVVAATVPGPTAVTDADLATGTQTTAVAPTYPHNINPDPNGPYYLNPYDPYQSGTPDHSPPVIGLSPAPDAPEPIHPPKHR